MSDRFVLGTVQFGLAYGINNMMGQPTREKVENILNTAHNNGITQLDTAAAYGSAQQLIGGFIKQTKKKFAINTKFHVDSDIAIPDQLDRSLDELGVREINIYYYHRFSDIQNVPSSIEVLKSLKHTGKIKKIGVSVYTNDEFEYCIYNRDVDVIQHPFNLLDNISKRGRYIQQAKVQGKHLQVRSVFLQGMFFKKTPFSERIKPLEKYVIRLQRLSEEYQVPLFELALGYVASKTELDEIIIGIDTEEQLVKNLQAAQISLPVALLQEIDLISVEAEHLLYPNNW